MGGWRHTGPVDALRHLEAETRRIGSRGGSRGNAINLAGGSVWMRPLSPRRSATWQIQCRSICAFVATVCFGHGEGRVSGGGERSDFCLGKRSVCYHTRRSLRCARSSKAETSRCCCCCYGCGAVRCLCVKGVCARNRGVILMLRCKEGQRGHRPRHLTERTGITSLLQTLVMSE